MTLGILSLSNNIMYPEGLILVSIIEYSYRICCISICDRKPIRVEIFHLNIMRFKTENMTYRPVARTSYHCTSGAVGTVSCNRNVV